MTEDRAHRLATLRFIRFRMRTIRMVIERSAAMVEFWREHIHERSEELARWERCYIEGAKLLGLYDETEEIEAARERLALPPEPARCVVFSEARSVLYFDSDARSSCT